MRARPSAAIVVLAALAVLATAGPTRAHEPGRGGPPRAPSLTADPTLAVIRAAPDFELADADGRTIRLSELRGRVALVSFIFTSCTAACPLLTQRMALLQQRLRGTTPHPVFVSITVDPARDSAAALAAYAARFGADRRSWHFVRDEPRALAAVLARWDEWTRPLPKGDVDHPARVHLVDPRGRVREIYSLEFFDERQAELDIRALLRETSAQ
jgi:cytochrome oxidase Cu insertion factor (SCO1/SenC/PrrC family)